MKTENKKYKDSGIPWIGLIPEDWEVCRLKNLHTDSNVGESIDKTFCSDNPNDILFYTAGLKPIHTTYLDFPKWKYTHKSNLLLSRNGTPYVYIPKEDAVYSDHIIRIDIDNRCSKEFVRYCLQQSIASVVVDSVSIATWSISLWDKQNIPIPPLPTQQRIADFLDRKCAEIDELAALQETMIAELKRYKQSVITEAVTKGLDKNVKFKDSGVEWIGEIPEGWEMRAIKTMATLKSGSNITTNDIKEEKIGFPVYGGNGLRGYYSEYSDDGNYALIGRQGALCGNINYAHGKFWATDHCVVCYPKVEFELIWFGETLRTMNLNQYSLSSAQPGLSVERIKEKLMPVPPLSEQRAIADYLDCKCAEIDELIAIKQQKIEALKEYKKSVIFEYVTGKKEV